MIPVLPRLDRAAPEERQEDKQLIRQHKKGKLFAPLTYLVRVQVISQTQTRRSCVLERHLWLLVESECG